MYESDDIARSIRRYLALALDEPWNLRLERREVRDEDRPVAVVEVGGPTPVRAREAVPQGEVETICPVTVTAYPPLASDPAEDEDPQVDAIRTARQESAKVATGLTNWLMYGMSVPVEQEDGSFRQWAGPYRIPLWDYAGVPLTGPKRAGPESPHDVLWVQRESISVEPIQDTEDLRRWSIACDFRVSMEAPGRAPDPDDPSHRSYIAERLEGHYHPPPPP